MFFENQRSPKVKSFMLHFLVAVAKIGLRKNYLI